MSVRQKVVAAARDYREAIKQIGLDIRAAPIKSAAWLGALGLVWFVVKRAPGERDYRAQLTRNIEEIGMLSEHVRSRATYEYLMHMGRLRDEGRLRVMNLGLFSLLLDSGASKGSCLPKDHEYGMRSVNPLTTLKESVQDFGWMGQWYNMSKNMVNYDVLDD